MARPEGTGEVHDLAPEQFLEEVHSFTRSKGTFRASPGGTGPRPPKWSSMPSTGSG